MPIRARSCLRAMRFEARGDRQVDHISDCDRYRSFAATEADYKSMK